LDEATSALDGKTSEAVMEAIEKMTRNSSRLFLLTLQI